MKHSDVEKLKEISRALKKKLKPYSKSQLISVILDQANRYNEQKQANVMLLERLKEYEEDSVTDVSDVDEQSSSGEAVSVDDEERG